VEEAHAMSWLLRDSSAGRFAPQGRLCSSVARVFVAASPQPLVGPQRTVLDRNLLCCSSFPTDQPTSFKQSRFRCHWRLPGTSSIGPMGLSVLPWLLLALDAFLAAGQTRGVRELVCSLPGVQRPALMPDPERRRHCTRTNLDVGELRGGQSCNAG
jgi:hypothetical protein